MKYYGMLEVGSEGLYEDICPPKKTARLEKNKSNVATVREKVIPLSCLLPHQNDISMRPRPICSIGALRSNFPL